MRKLYLILLLLSVAAFGQKPRAQAVNIGKETKKIMSLLNQYAGLSPFGEDEKRFDKISAVHDEIIERLLKILNDRRIAQHPIETELKNDELIISKSEDSKLYFLSLDQKSGGTFQAHTTLIHFRVADGSTHASYFQAKSADSIHTLDNLIYNEIYLLDAKAQKYLVIGGIPTCSTCYANAALILTLDGESYQTQQLELFDGRYGDLLKFEYDPETMTFVYEYNAGDNEDSLYGGDNEIQGFQHRYKTQYRYLNGRFVPLEKCEFWDKTDQP